MDIYTSGDMAFLEAIWTGLGHIWNGGYLRPVFASALMLNFLSGILRWIFDQKQPLFANFWQSILIYLIFFTSTTTVTLYKDHEGSRAIAGNFPIGFVAPASWLTTTGHSIANEFKSAITAVNTGWGWSSNNTILNYGIEPLELLVRMRNARVGQAGFNKSDTLSDMYNPGNASSGLSLAMNDYYQGCVAKYLVIAKHQPSKQKLFDYVMAANQASIFWKNFYISQANWPVSLRLDGSTVNTNCDDGWHDINTLLTGRAKAAAKAQLFSGLSDTNSNDAMAERLNQIEDVVAGLDPLGDSSAVYNLQTNAWAADLMYGACKESNILGPEFRQACRQQFDSIQGRRTVEASKAESFKEMVGPLVTFVEGFVYMITPLLLVIILFMGAAALKLIGKYMSALMWVVLMPVCQVAVDVYLNVYFNKWYYSVQSDPSGISLWSVAAQESHWTQLESFVAFAGTAQAMVPALAMFIIFAGVHTLQGLGAAASSGGSISAGAVTPQVSADAKAGSVSYGNDKVMMTRDVNGAYTSQIGVSSSVASANDSDFKMNMGAGAGISKVATANEAQVARAQAAVNHAYGQTYTDSVVRGDSINLNKMTELGYAKDEALKAAYVDSLSKSLNLSEDQRRVLSDNITVSYGEHGEAQIGVQGAFKADTGDSVVGGIFKYLGGASASLQVGGGVTAKADLNHTDAASAQDSNTESASKSEKIDHAVQDAYETSEKMNQNWKKSNVFSDTGSDTDKFDDSVSRTGATVAQYTQQLQQSEAYSKNLNNLKQSSVSSGESVVSASKTAGGFVALSGIINGNDAGGMKTGIDKSRDFLLEKFGGEELKGVDSRNLTAAQAKALNENIDEGEREVLNKLGLNVDRDSGFVEGSGNFISNKEQFLQMSKLSEADLKRISSPGAEANLSINDEARGEYQALRASALRNAFEYMNNLSDNAAYINADEALGASGVYFQHEGSQNIGGAGNYAGGRLDDIKAYGDKLVQVSENALNSEVLPKLTDVEVDKQLSTTVANGQKAVAQNINHLNTELGDMDGQSGEAVVEKGKAVVVAKNDLETVVTAETNTVDGLVGGQLVDPDSPQANARQELAEAQKRISGTASDIINIGRQDLLDRNSEMANDFLKSGFTQDNITEVQKPANIKQGQEAYKDLQAVRNFTDEKLSGGVLSNNSKLNTLLDGYNSFDGGESQKGLEKYLVESNRYNAADAQKVAAEYQALRSDFDKDVEGLSKNNGAKTVFALINQDSDLATTTNTDDFRKKLLSHENPGQALEGLETANASLNAPEGAGSSFVPTPSSTSKKEGGVTAMLGQIAERSGLEIPGGEAVNKYIPGSGGDNDTGSDEKDPADSKRVDPLKTKSFTPRPF